MAKSTAGRDAAARTASHTGLPRRAILSCREQQCLSLIAHGKTNRGISDMLGISEPTVALHLLNARKKLHALTREHAIAIAVSNGFISLEAAQPSL